MHEFSLIADLVRKITAVAREQDAAGVVGVTVRLGALAHISPDHFREHFHQGVRGTLAEGARLEIEMSADPASPHAQEVRLLSVDLEIPESHPTPSDEHFTPLPIS